MASTTDVVWPLSRRETAGAAGVTLGVLFPATILLSAFLLFQVQPLISKFILPWFGGSPAVWTTCLLFFQTLLFGGYLYAHLSERMLGRRTRAVVHLALLAAALAALPIAPSAAWKPAAATDPTWRILALLTATVGLPYFVLSATGPLVQAWLSRVAPGRSPYRLYALSNLGSLAALLSYPFVFEPRLAVEGQAWLWSVGFGLFSLCCGGAAVQAARLTMVESAGAAATGLADSCDRPTWAQRGLWVALPAFASMMLLATTNHVCQDVAVIPFLWVVPLSLYLLSFIICFDHERWYRRGLYGGATALLALLTAGLYDLPFDVPFLGELAVHFAVLFGLCMVCHGELVRLRPAPRDLTSFYLLIAAGGALGGAFVSLVAPVLFSTFFEWKIGLAGGYALAAVLLIAALAGRSRGRRWAWGVPLATVALLGLAAVIHFQTGSGRVPVMEARNFYGEVAVIEREGTGPLDRDYALFSGNIVHGVQFTCDGKRHEPTTYYSRQSGVGRALGYYGNRPSLRVGVIGLGVGTLAAYGRPGQTFRFYEINPEMIRVARTCFRYLGDSPATIECVPGDARLSLEREEPQRFDVLVLDAFSGDSVPAHLLTKEAFAIYRRHLVSDGALCIHITNRYLDLAPVIRGLAHDADWPLARIVTPDDETLALYQADWLILSRNRDFLRSLPVGGDDDARALLWTDSHSDLFRILK